MHWPHSRPFGHTRALIKGLIKVSKGLCEPVGSESKGWVTTWHTGLGRRSALLTAAQNSTPNAILAPAVLRIQGQHPQQGTRWHSQDVVTMEKSQKRRGRPGESRRQPRNRSWPEGDFQEITRRTLWSETEISFHIEWGHPARRHPAKHVSIHSTV